MEEKKTERINVDNTQGLSEEDANVINAIIENALKKVLGSQADDIMWSVKDE